MLFSFIGLQSCCTMRALLCGRGPHVAVHGPIANIPYIDIACYSHMSNPSLLAPLQDLPQIPCLFPALAWLFGRSQAAPLDKEVALRRAECLHLLVWLLTEGEVEGVCEPGGGHLSSTWELTSMSYICIESLYC